MTNKAIGRPATSWRRRNVAAGSAGLNRSSIGKPRDTDRPGRRPGPPRCQEPFLSDAAFGRRRFPHLMSERDERCGTLGGGYGLRIVIPRVPLCAK